MSAVADAPVQPSLRRMRRFGVRPDRELGQNFLIDSNILGVIDRAAELDARTSCWRSAAAWGCSRSTSPSASATCTWSRSTSACARRCSTRPTRTPTSSVHWGDAMTDRPARAAPAADEGRGEPALRDRRGVLLRTIEELPSVRSWVAMVQREVGERLAAAPGSGDYGTPSVIAQLACEVRGRAGDPAHGVPSGAERRLGARGPAPAPPGRMRRHPSPALRARSSAAPSPTGARRSPARWRCPAAPERSLARAGAGGAGGARPSRGRARRAPLAGGLPRAGARSGSSHERPTARSRPRRSTSGCSSGRRGRTTAGTSW